MSGSDWTQTPNLALYKPIPGADDDQWGDRLNVNADVLDNSLLTTGGTMTGPLALPNGSVPAPSLQLGANDGTGISRSVNALVMSVQGVTVFGTFINAAQIFQPLYMLNNRIQQVGDATAPADALNQRTGDARYAPLSGAGAYLPLTGGTLTGPLMVPAGTVAAPGLTVGTNNSGLYGLGSTTAISSIGTQVATYGLGGNTSLVPLSMNNQRITSLANATAATDALNQQTGDARYAPIGAGVTSWNTRTGAVVLTTADVTGAGGAPLNAPVFTGDARAVTPAAGDNDTSIATTAFVQAAVAPAMDNVGRNLLHNPLMNVAQRGPGPWTASGFTADRWLLSAITDTISASLISLADADRAQIGDEGAWNGYQAVFAGSAAAGAFSCLTQDLEDIRRFSNKTATVSFWAKAAAGTPSLGVTWYQDFGSGGSPSAIVLGTGVAVTLSTTWTRYTRTIAFPSITGKTLGTNGDSYTALRFGFSSGATNASFIGVGVQSATISLWGVQIEIGSVATPLEKPDPRYDLSNCQRFFQPIMVGCRGFASGAGQHTATTVSWPPMRATPSQSVFSGGSAGNISSAPLTVNNNYSGQYDIISNGAGDYYASGVGYFLSADL